MGEHQVGGSAQAIAPATGAAAPAAVSTAMNCNHQFIGDTTFTKVFVGGLAWETQRDTLRRHFEQYGEILEAAVIIDKNTGRSKGYGFVTFRDSEGARRACLDATPIIDGRRANCNLASLGAHRSRPATPLHGSRMGGVMSPYSPGSHPGGASFVGSPAFPQHVLPNYQIYGFSPFSQDYGYQQQGVYNPYGIAQYAAQMYAGAVSSPVVYSPYGSMQFMMQPLQAAAAGGGGSAYPFTSSSPAGSGSGNSSASYGGGVAAPHSFMRSSSSPGADASGNAAPIASLPLQQPQLPIPSNPANLSRWCRPPTFTHELLGSHDHVRNGTLPKVSSDDSALVPHGAHSTALRSYHETHAI